MITETFDSAILHKTLKTEAKALGIPSGAADSFIKLTLLDLEKSFGTKKIITKHDLNRAVYKELKKYHPDFAYVYKNRDKII